MSITNEVPYCLICSEEGNDDSGQPLRRDCSCRGSDSGFVHLSCLVEYAKHKTKQWDGRDFHELTLARIWEECLNCKQWYQNELRVELTTEFLSFVKTNYSDDQRMNITALYRKLVSLTHMVNDQRCTPQAIQEAKSTSNKILSIIEMMKAEECALLKQDKYIEPFTYNCLGIIAIKEGTKDSLKEAVSHNEKFRDLSILLGLIDDVAVAEYNISVAKGKCGEGISIEKKVEQSQKLYDMRLRKHGEGAIKTLIDGTIFAEKLMEACRLAEAESLLIKLVTISQQVHGSNHEVTKSIVLVQRHLMEQLREQKRDDDTGTEDAHLAQQLLRTKHLNRVLFLSIILASILSMYKISYGVSVVLSGVVVSLYFL